MGWLALLVMAAGQAMAEIDGPPPWAGESAGDVKGLVFKAKVDDAAYRKFIGSVPADRLDIDAIVKDPLPPLGLHIDEVTPGGQAEKAGIEANWVIIASNGKRLWEHRVGTKPIDRSRELEIATPGGLRKFHVEPGKIGVMLSNREVPEKYLATHTPRGKWDTDLLIAMVGWERGRHEITETAIARALANGMKPNAFSSYYGAMLAIDHGDHDTARRFLVLFKQGAEGNKAIPRFFLPGLSTLAFQYHDFAFLKLLVGEEADLPEKIKPSDIDIWNRAEVDLSKPLLPQARALAGKDVMAGIERVNEPFSQKMGVQDPRPLRGGRYLHFGEPNRNFKHYFVPPTPMRDGIWEMRMVFGNAEAPSQLVANSICVAFNTLTATRPADPAGHVIPGNSMLAQIAFLERYTGERWTEFAGAAAVRRLYNQRLVPFLDEAKVALLRGRDITDPIPEGFRSIRLSLVRLGNEVEISVDDQAFLRLPIDPDIESIGCFIRIVGTAVAIEDMTLRLISRPE